MGRKRRIGTWMFGVLTCAASAAAQVDSTPTAGPLPTCSIDREPTRIDLQSNGLRAVQVALAPHRDGAVALVTMSRTFDPRAPRDGVTYPESRWIVFDSTSASPTVRRSVGFEPDAAFALHASGRALVLSPSRRDWRGGADQADLPLRATVLDALGNVVVPTRDVEGTFAHEIDSRVVATRDGFHVVLGRTTRGIADTDARVDESLVSFDAAGRVSRPPASLVNDGVADSLVRHRVGLAADESPGSPGSLWVSWASDTGAQRGTFCRRLALDDAGTSGAAERIDSRVGAGPIVSSLGSVAFRAALTTHAAMEVFARVADRGETVRVQTATDASLVYARDALLVFDTTTDGTGRLHVGVRRGDRSEDVSTTVRSSVSPTVRSSASPASWLDHDAAATTDGAWFAWIQPDDGPDDVVHTSLFAMHVHCERRSRGPQSPHP